MLGALTLEDSPDPENALFRFSFFFIMREDHAI